MFKSPQYIWTGCIVHIRVLSRIYQLREKSWVAEGHKVPRRSGVCPPEIFWNEYALRCNVVHFATQFWETLQCAHWSRRVWMIFPIKFLVYCNSFYPSNTLERTLDINFRPFWNQLYREWFMIKSNVLMSGFLVFHRIWWLYGGSRDVWFDDA